MTARDFRRRGLEASACLVDMGLTAALGFALQQPWLALGAHCCFTLGITNLAARGESPAVQGLFGGLYFLVPWLCFPILLRSGGSSEAERTETARFRFVPRPDADHIALADERSDQSSFAQLMSLRGQENTHAVPALRDKLQDSDDEVRLLAFAMLDRRESDIQRRIEQARGRLQSREHPSASASLHQALAESHLELVRSGLVGGAFASRALETAEEHCRQGLAARPSASLYMLLAGVLFEQKRFEDCRYVLFDALRDGAPPYPVFLVMAELAFEERRFDLVDECLARLESLSGVPPTAESRGLWTRGRAA
jgi:hypothetical protein